ncbi:MAG: HEAT repeat domain-containing protein [Planctomycetota bacterium]|jgi:HEAT repeat protein
MHRNLMTRRGRRPKRRWAGKPSGLLLCCLLILLLGVGEGCKKKTAEQQGKTAPEWIQELEKDDGKCVQVAKRNLTKIGHHAVMDLNAGMTHEKSAVRQAITEILGEIGPRADAAVPALTKALTDTNATVRTSAAESLGKIGPAARPAIPDLLKAAKDTDPAVRANAITALVLLGARGEDALPVLRERLGDEDQTVQDCAAYAIAGMGTDALPAKADLIAALKKGDTLRWPAVLALMEIEPGGKSAIEPMVALLKDPAPKIRAGAAKVLGMIGGRAREASADLRGMLGDGEVDVRAMSVWALGRLYLGVRETGETAEGEAGGSEKKEDEEEKARRVREAKSTEEAIASPEGREVIAAVQGALKDAVLLVRLRAAEALLKMNTGIPGAVEVMVAALDDPIEDLMMSKNRNIVVWVAELLGSVGEKGAPGIPKLVEVLESEDLEDEPDVLVMVIKTLGKLGSEAKKAIPALCELMEFTDYEEVAVIGIRLLGSFKTGSNEVISALLKGLKDELFQKIRKEAADALGEIGPAAEREEVTQALEEAVKNDKYDMVKNAAAAALEKIKGK